MGSKTESALLLFLQKFGQDYKDLRAKSKIKQLYLLFLLLLFFILFGLSLDYYLIFVYISIFISKKENECSFRAFFFSFFSSLSIVSLILFTFCIFILLFYFTFDLNRHIKGASEIILEMCTQGIFQY